MLTVDSCESVKKGKESVGVARQYCGEVGKVENCQSGVFVGYSSEKGYGLLELPAVYAAPVVYRGVWRATQRYTRTSRSRLPDKAGDRQRSA